MIAVDLSGRIALVTGGSGELGRVICRTLAACGADVAVHYLRDETGATSVAADVAALGRRSCTAQADVTDLASVRHMADTVANTLGEPDLIVANAVIQIHPWSSILEEEVDDYRSQFESCVMQSVHLAKAFIPAMQRRGGGRYIAINTECAIQAAANTSAYTAGKRGLDGVMRALAREVGSSGITVNQIAPGYTVTDHHPQVEADAGYIRSVPLGRRGTAQEIANVVAFVASDLASFVTGAFIPVSGGTVMPAI